MNHQKDATEEQGNKNIPTVLCPFLERVCPHGEDTARLCHRLMNSGVEMVDDFAGPWVECILAAKMFASGLYPCN